MVYFIYIYSVCVCELRIFGLRTRYMWKYRVSADYCSRTRIRAGCLLAASNRIFLAQGRHHIDKSKLQKCRCVRSARAPVHVRRPTWRLALGLWLCGLAMAWHELWPLASGVALLALGSTAVTPGKRPAVRAASTFIMPIELLQ